MIIIACNFILNQYFINKCTIKLRDLNIINPTQDCNFTKWAICYQKNNYNNIIHKYGIRRYALNTKHKSIKNIALSSLAIFLVLTSLAYMHDFNVGLFKPTTIIIDEDGNTSNEVIKHSSTSKNNNLKYETTANEIVLKYKDQEKIIKKNDVRSIESTEKLPRINNNIDGYQNNGINIGNFNLQGNIKTYLFLDRSQRPFIKISLKDGSTLFINDNDETFFENLKTLNE
jgi:hypothetical protein